MKRPGWVTGVVVAQFLCGALLLGTCFFLADQIYRPEIKKETDRAVVIHGLKLAIGILAPVAVMVFVGAWGLLKGKLWGWWLVLLINFGLFGILVYSMVDDGLSSVEWDVFTFAAAALLLAIWLLVPAVRRFCWNDPGTNGNLAG